jgi:hypothetical protein
MKKFVAFFLIFLIGCSTTSSNLVLEEFSISNNSIGVNEKISVNVKARDESGLSFLIIESGNKTESFNCENKRVCSANFELYFVSPGLYSIKLTVVSSNGKKIERKEKVFVLDTLKKCSDGTLFGECSKTKPFFCDNGVLKSNCNKCGCSNDLECLENGECSSKQVIPEIFSLSVLNGDSFFKEGQELKLLLGVKSSEKIFSGTSFKVFLEFLCNNQVVQKNFHTILFDSDVLPETEIFFEIIGREDSVRPFIVSNKCDYDVRVSLFNVSTEIFDENFLTQKLFENVFSVIEDNEAPSAPSGLKAELSGEKVVLSWNANSESDLSHYVVYKSNQVSEIFISYEKLLETTENSVELTGLGKGTHFFVVTAVDFVENESEYSNVAQIELE